MNDKNNFEIIICNQGKGLNEEEIRLISKKFTTLLDMTKHSSSKTAYMGGGIGIGIYITKQIAKVHNGDLIYYSRGEKKGLKCILTIPLTH